MNPINSHTALTGNHLHPADSAKVNAKTAGGQPAVAAGQQNPPVPQDQVTLSATARSLLAAQTAPTGGARLGEIKAALANGSYQISPQRIAQGMIQDNQQLLVPAPPAGKA
ncbi:MAG: flagellar biosynthesis anti-sigma factor FlgM [Gammaproteobacteria bacterium]|nr:flagellar biosynthesis anti-sigma factor FlgM [Gammaproteobacteria bacterium]